MQHGQTPLGTPFGPYTTAQEVIRDIDLTGKTAVVTGGASNLGLETVRVLAWRGARVIVPVRDTSTARKVLSNVPNVELFEMDLLDPPLSAALRIGLSLSMAPRHSDPQRGSDGHSFISRCGRP